MAINLTKLTRWDYFDKKTSEVFKPYMGGVLQHKERMELAALITRPTYFLHCMHQMLQDSNKLGPDQNRVCKYIMMYVNKSQVFGTNTAGKPKPCIVGFAIDAFHGSAGLPLEIMLAMKHKGNTAKSGEGSLVRYVYGKSNPNDYRFAIYEKTIKHLKMNISI